MLTKWGVASLVVGLIALALVGPWVYKNIQESNRRMEQVQLLMNPTPPDVIVPEPKPAQEAQALVPEVIPVVEKVSPVEPVPVPVLPEPSHVYTSTCAPDVPMQSSRRGDNLRFAWTDQAGVYPCLQRNMDHTAPRPLPPGRYELPYGTVTVLPRQ